VVPNTKSRRVACRLGRPTERLVPQVTTRGASYTPVRHNPFAIATDQGWQSQHQVDLVDRILGQRLWREASRKAVRPAAWRDVRDAAFRRVTGPRARERRQHAPTTSSHRLHHLRCHRHHWLASWSSRGSPRGMTRRRSTLSGLSVPGTLAITFADRWPVAETYS
jgi:hypothetical protein